MIVVVLAVLGLCLGSFVNALVWRLRTGRDWVKARSICPKCKHQLAAKDLVPVLSWLSLRGRCRYCKKPISAEYLIVELIMALVFVASYLFWPVSLNQSGQVLLLVTWLVASVGLMALAVYDWHTKLLPTVLVYLTTLIAVIGRLGYIIWFSTDKANDLKQWILAVAVAAGIFGLIYIGSRGRMIGAGDIRLGLATGTLLAQPSNAFLMIFFASLLGSFFALPSLMRKNIGLKSELPFGPFLIAATFIALLFGSDISSWYQGLLTP
jgi:leader peptidase (prepilin peptidase)/N-methyltransferase